MTPDQLFEQLAADFSARGVTAGAMFGKRALHMGGKAFACLKGDLLAFRLGAGSSAHAEALVLSGAALFDPSGKGRPFKDWVAIPHSHADEWSRFTEAAFVTATGS
ncbi:hypothetical protein [Nocardia brasiliensis]